MNDGGFPLRLVEQFNARTGVWRARRRAGELGAEAELRIGGTSLAELAWDSLDRAPDDVELTARLIERALRLVPRRFDTDARLVELVGSLASRRINVRFMRQHHRLAHIEQRRATSLLICTDIAPALGVSIDATKDDLVAEAPEQLRAFEMLLAFVLFYSFAVESGDSPRQAMRWIAGLYDQLARRERSHLHHLLESRHLDAGNHVSVFLRRVSEQGADAGHWREQQITWLLGQDRLDLPYNRRAAIDVLMSEADVDDKRFLLYDVVRDYDRDLEGDNILRIAAEVRDRGQQLVFGRMSRAFHNQGTLFANASLLAPQPTWAQLGDQLWQAVSGNAELETVALELKLLLQGSREVALTQIEGACERFEEAVLDAQRDELMGRILDARRLIEDHGDELVQPLLPAMAEAGVVKATQNRLEIVDEVRRELLSAPSRDAAYVVISQRPSPTGSHLLVKINEFDEPYLGKAANLRKLVRLAGDRVYSSPDYRWLRLADHWIEAIPLFIKEEVLIVDGHEQTRTVIDIAGMEESFREEMSDHWAANIQDVLRSEFAAAARGLLWTARQNPETADGSSPLGDESTILNWAKDQAQNDNITDSICAIAAAIQAAYLADPVAAQIPVETAEQEPYQALCTWLTTARPQAVTGILEAIEAEQTDQRLSALGSSQSIAWERFGPHALAPRRALPVLHVLTTQSAGMTEGYVRTWLEESMALHQVVEAAGLAGEVEERQRRFRQRLGALGACIIRELGIWVEVEETAAEEGIEEMSAVGRVVGRNRTVQEEVGVLGALLELQEQLGVVREATDIDDPVEVAQTLVDHEQSLAEDALVRVADRNGANLEAAIDDLLHRHTSLDRDEALRHVVDTDEDFRQDRTTFTRFLARRHLLQSWAAAQGIDAEDRIATYTRRYGRLAKTTARKQIVLEKGLQAQTLHSAHRLAAKGAGKGYHLLYTPSRVDLGHRERESVETWAQWVGGADRAAARAGRQIYGLINKSVRSFDSLTEPEVLKTGENASMASHFAYSNAMSLMVSASGHGDVEEMGDQMSRRGDRIIHPAGEGYGGYCVPKDGLFLEFVLTLGRREKLRQLGIPTEHHDRVASLANSLLDRRDDFDTRFAWDAWATELLADESALGELMQIRSGASPGAAPIPVFQVTRLAEVLVGLGQPELRDPERVTAALVARWGIHKMVAGAEHVNRFMPFYKAWLLRRGLNEAERRAGTAGPSGSSPGRPFVGVFSAEYKPDTQDGRFAAGMRKFEILTGSAQHLLYALDSDGQLLATLLSSGFEVLAADGRGPRVARMLGLAEGDTDQLSGLFPAPRAAAELRVVSPTGLSTQDLLSYTSDTPLEAIAEDARAILLKAGITEAELEANVLSFGPRIDRWATSAPLEEADLNTLAERVGMGIHALALQVAGPERSYDRALQGADVLDLGIPHQELLDMLADPSRVARLMLEDRPDSALVIVDGASGARRRALNRIDVMLWFAVAERLGRESTYVSIGLGAGTVESWRVAMRRQRERASGLLAALESGDTQEAETCYRRIVDEMHEEQEAQLQLAEVAKLRRFGRLRSRDEALTRSLADLAAGRALQELTFLDFLALGGLFLLDGAKLPQILSTHSALGEGLARLGRNDWPSWDDEPAATLVNAQLPPAVEDFREEKGLESSNKASEDRPVVALEARSQLAARVEQARALNERQFAYQAVDADSISFDEAYSCAKASLGTGGDEVSEAAFGTFLGYARNALFALVSQLYEEDNADDAQRFVEHLSQLFMGRQIDNEHWRQIAGGYEDLGDFGRLAQVVAEQSSDEPLRQRQLEMIARGGELFYILLAVDSVLPHIRGEGDAPSLWRALADFFAETINDHFHEYRPWIYSRGIGFAALEGDELYAFSLRHHGWLYRFLRRVVTGFTEVAALPVDEQDLLLGNYLDDAQVGAIGAGAATQVERHWRSYGQLRELAFIRNDGFPLPEVFDAFDPDLIDADKRVNHVIALPVGRTHYSRALREAPTLARELTEQGRPGANLIITRRVEFTEDKPRAQVVVEGGHLYLSAEAYAEALTRHKGVSATAARAAAQATHAKGRRIAARFSRPVRASVVYPFHGDPDYASGKLEDCGLPYSVQSLFHTWTTYDKAKYPDIFEPQDGVDTPQEIDWLAVDTSRAPDEVTARRWITDGIDGGYTGLREFAGVHRLVMIKDAAESGGRNARAFVLRTVGSSTIDEEALEEAVDFIYQVSLRHNVAIQEVIVSSPEYWATPAFLDDFVRRQIIEWGSAVERDRRPKSPLYGSHRVIVSTDDPLADDPERWHLSHWITLNSKQLITNVGRGGCLEQFLPRYIEPRHHEALFTGLRDAARAAMEALAAYEVRQGHTYEAEQGRQVGKDLAGVSYGMPRYLMLDYLVTPDFVEDGDLVEVRHDEDGATFILQQAEQRIQGTVDGWRIVLIEPNIGVGLWDRVALREEAHELAASRTEDRPFEWDRVGENARIVLRDLSRGGEQYLAALQEQTS